MKKLNFDNEEKKDDQPLINLIKTADLEEPSSSFVDTTLSQYLAVKNQGINKHKQLKLPLILMLVLAVLLILPLLLNNIGETSFIGSIQELYVSSDDLEKWYLIYPMTLLLVLVLLTQITMRFDKHPKLME